MSFPRHLRTLACGLSICFSAPATANCDDPNPLRFSMSPTVVAEDLIKESRPLLDRLEASLGRRVVAIVPHSYNAVIAEFLSGNIDLALLGPASYSIAKSRNLSITPFATKELLGGDFVKTGKTYNSMLVTLKGRGIADVKGVRGRSVMLSDPASTSGAVIPRDEFGSRVGEPLDRYFGKVGYSGSHDRSLEALRKGYVDAVFVASQRVDDAIRKGRLARTDIVVLWQSRPIPHDPYVYRGKLCPALQEKIREAFLGNGAAASADRYVAVSDEDYTYLHRILAPPKQQ